MWRDIGSAIVNLRDISMVQLNEDDEKVVITLNSNQRIVLPASDSADTITIYNFIADLLESVMESDNSREKDQAELLSGILSELKLISQNLRRL